jgi:hypothetical protein
VDAELGSLSGGPLSRALEAAARSGRALRLLLDPTLASTRMEGERLASISPCAQVRWDLGPLLRRRWLRIDGTLQLVWRSGTLPQTLSATSEAGRFEDAWKPAGRRPPEAMRLKDLLFALPDPRETSPHYVRRRDGGAP